MPDLRVLGSTDIKISPVALGCWPISGMTTLDVTEGEALATLEACFETGVNFLDTAYCYGTAGESERLIAKATRGRRDQVAIATKCGLHWRDGKQVRDGTPLRLRQECDESLRRLATDRVELLYLHAPDPNTAVAESAGELKRLMDEGKTRSVGVSNLSLEQLDEFAAVCPIAAFQPPYNMLQREIELDTLPWCRERNISVMVYWPLLKGLLAGKLPRDLVIRPGDGRAKYPMFQGDEFHKNQDLIDRLRPIAAEAGRTVAQLVINWTIHRPGITAALCGARRPDQLRENAGAMGWRLSPAQLERIDAALADRGLPQSRAAV